MLWLWGCPRLAVGAVWNAQEPLGVFRAMSSRAGLEGCGVQLPAGVKSTSIYTVSDGSSGWRGLANHLRHRQVLVRDTSSTAHLLDQNPRTWSLDKHSRFLQFLR